MLVLNVIITLLTQFAETQTYKITQMEGFVVKNPKQEVLQDVGSVHAGSLGEPLLCSAERLFDLKFSGQENFAPIVPFNAGLTYTQKVQKRENKNPKT